MLYTLIYKAVRQHVQRTATPWVLQPWKGPQRKLDLLKQEQHPAGVGPPLCPRVVLLHAQRRVDRAVLHAQRRTFSVSSIITNNSRPQRDHGDNVSVSRHQPGTRPSTAQKVKEAGRDFTYLIVVVIGLGVTGGLLYVVFQELFSTSSPNKVYGKAFDRVKSHPEVIGAFGEPIKCYGETTRRQRRQHVSHSEYLKDGQKHMRLKFYIEGVEPGLKGTVHTDSKENIETGKYEFRYIFVDVDSYPRRTIVVEDNR